MDRFRRWQPCRGLLRVATNCRFATICGLFAYSVGRNNQYWGNCRFKRALQPRLCRVWPSTRLYWARATEVLWSLLGCRLRATLGQTDFKKLIFRDRRLSRDREEILSRTRGEGFVSRSAIRERLDLEWVGFHWDLPAALTAIWVRFFCHAHHSCCSHSEGDSRIGI